jgi:hypothetical protein
MENSGNPGVGLSQWYLPNCCDSSADINPPVSTNFPNGGGIYNSGFASAGPSFDHNHTPNGHYSAVLKIDTSGGTTSGARLFRWREPRNPPMNDSDSDLYYSVWYYFPQTYTPNGTPTKLWNVFQWKSKSPTLGNSPMFNLEVGSESGQMYLYLCPPSFVNGGNCYSQTGPPYTFIPVGKWTHVEARYVCSGLATGGLVTIWQDGTQLWDVPNVQTRYADGDCSWSVNNYSNGLSPARATIYVDDAEICSGGACP